MTTTQIHTSLETGRSEKTTRKITIKLGRAFFTYQSSREASKKLIVWGVFALCAEVALIALILQTFAG